jgi:hypothetical protein
MGDSGPVFRFAGFNIVMTEDYEALGRYTSAKEAAERFALERNVYLRKLGGLASMAGTPVESERIAHRLDEAEARGYLEKAIDLNRNMLLAIQEANSYADACKKRKLGE